jgi:multidrug transporter EmrE-like cation transporter
MIMMMMTGSSPRYLPALLLPLLLLTAGQLSAALSGRAISAGSTLINPFSLLTYLFFALRGFSWILVVRHLKLSLAYPVMSLAYCLVPPAAVLLLGESLDAGKAAGMVLVTAGVLLVGSGERKKPL